MIGSLSGFVVLPGPESSLMPKPPTAATIKTKAMTATTTTIFVVLPKSSVRWGGSLLSKRTGSSGLMTSNPVSLLLLSL